MHTILAAPWIWPLSALIAVAVEGRNMCLVTTFDDADYQGEVRISANDQLLSTVNYRGSNADVELKDFAIPADARQMNFAGTLQYRHYRRGIQRATIDYKLQIVDLTPLTRPLRETKQTWSERMRRLAKCQSAFEDDHPDIMEEITVEFPHGDTVSQQEIATAEKRLGYKLPAEHCEMLCNFGVWQSDDSFMITPAQMNNSYDQMIQLWETPQSAMEMLPAKIKELLRNSVILYTEVGDGYSAWLYQPSPQDSVDGASYYWISQDEIVRPTILANRDGSKKNYSQSMLWLVANQVLSRYVASSIEVVFVDHHPGARLAYRMRPDADDQGLKFELDVEWEKFE